MENGALVMSVTITKQRVAQEAMAKAAIVKLDGRAVTMIRMMRLIPSLQISLLPLLLIEPIRCLHHVRRLTIATPISDLRHHHTPLVLASAIAMPQVGEIFLTSAREMSSSVELQGALKTRAPDSRPIATLRQMIMPWDPASLSQLLVRQCIVFSK